MQLTPIFVVLTPVFTGTVLSAPLSFSVESRSVLETFGVFCRV